MVVSLKDGVKLIGISIVCVCAVYVCTFMLNFYLDVSPLREEFVETPYLALYDAQLSMARFTAALAGGFLAAIAVVMLLFYIKLYIETHAVQLGIIKALGYSRARLSVRFWVFGLSVLVGCLIGFGAGWASMPFIYDSMTIEGMGEIAISFHWQLPIFLVAVPFVLFSFLACGYAYLTLRRPVMQLLRGAEEKVGKGNVKQKRGTFLAEMRRQSVCRKKTLAFFITFSCFCFASMVQMGFSMEDLSAESMGTIILAIGVTLAVVSMLMAVTSLVRANEKSLSVMKAFGYSVFQRTYAIFGGYVPFLFLGFGVGTVYQYGLLRFMVNVVFSDVGQIPHYEFDVPVFFGTLGAFILCYAAVFGFYTWKINRISVKAIMAEN